MKLKINITKEVLRRSLFCGIKDECYMMSENCAIAIATREIFPDAAVSYRLNDSSPYIATWINNTEISLPHEAGLFMREFDGYSENPIKRLSMKETSFEIEVPEEVINQIGIDQVYKILSESKTLELVN